MKRNQIDWAALIISFLFSLAYWNGIPAVPFHPDESTQIYMSGDVELFVQNPANLAWNQNVTSDGRLLYRLLDAPLTRYMIGIGRAVYDLPALPVDWNWSLTWQDNDLAGALPSHATLWAARLSVAWLFPFTLILTYLCGKKIAGQRLGLLALIAVAGNALVLLHTRRSMAESALLFTTVLALWSILTFQKWTWLAAIPAALAVAAKQTAVAFMAVGLVCLVIQHIKNMRELLKNLGLYFALILAITLALNPFLWQQPINAALASMSARQDLTQRQVNEFHQSIPSLVLDTLPERSIGMIANLYLTPLQFNEVGNYVDQTRPAETAYLAEPLQTLFRSLPGGLILLFSTIVGFVLAAIKIYKQGIAQQCGFSILILTSFSFSLIFVLTIPFSFQRYILPLVPLTIFFTVYPLDLLIGFGWNRRKFITEIAASRSR